MERKLVTEKELLALLNAALKRTGKHGNYYFDSVVRLRIEDRTGCNWAYAHLQGSASVSKSCPPAAEKIVNKARTEYNLK